MGNSSSVLTQHDIEEICKFSQQEIVSLYKRFCQLDRIGCGFISAEELMTVPEFVVNPLSQRLFRMLDGLNFKEFVAFLSAFSPRASLHHKVEFIFKVYDKDNNGTVTFYEMLEILRDLTGHFLPEQLREKKRTGKSLWDKQRKIYNVSSYLDDVLHLISDASRGTIILFHNRVLTQVLEEAGYTKDCLLVQADFMKILGNSDLKMEVDIPVD